MSPLRARVGLESRPRRAPTDSARRNRGGIPVMGRWLRSTWLSIGMALAMVTTACSSGNAPAASTAVPGAGGASGAVVATAGPAGTAAPVGKYGGILNIGLAVDPGHFDTHQKDEVGTRMASTPAY